MRVLNEKAIHFIFTPCLDQLNIYETAMQKIDDYFREGFRAYDKVNADEQRKNDLRVYVEKLIDREN